MKLSIFIISVLFISFNLTAQTKIKNQPSEENSSKKIKVSDLKKNDFKPIQVSTRKIIMSENNSEKLADPKIKTKNKTIRKPKQ